MKNLHEKFLKTVPFAISYSLFTRFRPFWVVSPTLSNRDTCACTIHENMDLQLAALKKANILTTVSNYILQRNDSVNKINDYGKSNRRF